MVFHLYVNVNEFSGFPNVNKPYNNLQTIQTKIKIKKNKSETRNFEYSRSFYIPFKEKNDKKGQTFHRLYNNPVNGIFSKQNY